MSSRIWTFSMVAAIAMGSVTALADDSSGAAAGVHKPCQQIVQACTAAGFVKGEYKQGKGLWRDCVDPLIQGKTVNSAIPLPKVDPNAVSACRAKRPKFGEGKVGS